MEGNVFRRILQKNVIRVTKEWNGISRGWDIKEERR